MNIREQLEMSEMMHLSPYASLSVNSKGRDRYEDPCDLRTCYQRDKDRIYRCKAFRRIKHKTQVFLAPQGDHYRTRMTHTLEVAQIGRTIARALRLNEDLTETIALGHDLGHSPFGHAGEAALNEVCPYGFKHSEQSVRIVELLEKNCQGLNLTYEVRDGIRNHSMSSMPSTLEGKIIRLSDKLAYINHDIEDAIRGHIIVEDDLPVCYTNILGHSSKERLHTLIHDIINNSYDRNDIIMSPEIHTAMMGLRKFMLKDVYEGSKAKAEEVKAQGLLIRLYNYYIEHVELMGAKYVRLIEEFNEPKERVVCDYIAGMTDRYAISKYEELCVPSVWKVY